MTDESPKALAGVVVAWLTYLGQERRLAAKTLEAYGRDVRQFVEFLHARIGRTPSAADFAAMKPADLRAFLAARRAADIDPRSLQRALSALRGLAKFMERIGAGRASAFSAIRAPKAGRRLPRPLRSDDARVAAEGRRAAVRRRARRAAQPAHRATGDGADARRARPARQRDAARLAPFLRHASLGARRRSAHDPGTPRPCLAIDDAGLHGRRQRPADRRLQGGSPARVAAQWRRGDRHRPERAPGTARVLG